jgi:hypothetical protein
MFRGRPLYLIGNDDEPEHAITRKNATTGLTEAATGLTGLTFHLAATVGGAAIHANLSKTATERGTTGIYYAVFEGTDLDTQLDNATYKGRDVYQCFTDGANVNFWVARKVVEFRP